MAGSCECRKASSRSVKCGGILYPAANLGKKEYASSSYVSRCYCKEDTMTNCSQHVKSSGVSLYIDRHNDECDLTLTFEKIKHYTFKPTQLARVTKQRDVLYSS